MRSDGLLAFVCISTVIFTAAILLRYYIRLRIIHRFGLDDWILIPLWMLMLFCNINGIISTRYGLGSHIYTLDDHQISRFIFFSFIASAGYLCTIIVFKSSFLLQYRRAFPLPFFQRICDLFLVVLFLWLVATITAFFCICHPLADQWNPMKLKTSKPCDARYRFWLTNGILHLITDVFIFLMPLPMIWGLPLPRLQKFFLGVVLCLGLFTCSISAVRLATLHNALLTMDQSNAMATTIFWSVAEMTSAVLCLCIPTFRPLVNRRSRVHSTCNETDSPEQSQPTPRLGFSTSESWAEAYHEALREREMCDPQSISRGD